MTKRLEKADEYSEIITFGVALADAETTITKTILIIKSNPQAVTAAETFLRNRDWRVLSTTNLKDALNYLVQNKPSFVMVSVDHPNKKVRTLPKVLIQAFPVCVIAFVEQTSTSAYRLLLDASCEYKINPPLTGPSIERTVNKYIRDKQKQAEELKNPKEAAGTGQSKDGLGDVMTFKNDKGPVDYSKQEIESSDLSSILASLTQEENNTAGSGIDSQSKAGGAAYMPSATTSKNTEPGSIGYRPEQANSSNGPSGVSGESDEPRSSMILNPKVLKSGSGPMILGPNDPASGGAVDDEKTNPGVLGIAPNGSAANKQDGSLPEFSGGVQGMASALGNSKANDSTAGGTFGEGKNGSGGDILGGANGQPLDAEQNAKRSRQGDVIFARADDDETPTNQNQTPPSTVQSIATRKKTNTWGATEDNDSIIVKGAQKAMQETVEFGDGKVSEQLNDSTNVACIVVESTRFSGYLVAALGKDRKIDHEFIQGIQTKLVKFLKDNGEVIDNEDSLNMKIKKVDFEDWALEYAQFLKKSVHKGNEVAMAFFPRKPIKTQVGQSADSDMASVSLAEVRADVPLDFNLYMYMPLNKKYVLYTPKGAKLYSHQKARLEGQGVKEMHMLKSEVQDLGKHHAQNYLNDMIDDHHQKKQRKPA